MFKRLLASLSFTAATMLLLGADRPNPPRSGPAVPSNGPSASPVLAAPAPNQNAGSFLESAQQDRELTLQLVQSEVRLELDKARASISTNPTSVVTNIKLLLDRVVRMPDLSPETRLQLRGQIQAVLRQAEQHIAELESRQQEAQQGIGIQKDIQRAMAELERKIERSRQLQDRVTSLLDEGRATGNLQKNIEASTVAEEGRQLNPAWPQHGNALANNSVEFTKMYATYLEQTYVRDLRLRGLLDTLTQAEWSHIPSTDGEPIVYPHRDDWARLIQERNRFSRTDYRSAGPAEARIQREFQQPTSFDFVETPLVDAINYLKEKHEIEIQFDAKALTDVGITTERPISKTLRGITLRSALQLLLRDLDLTYVIKNEVLLITTPEEASKQLVVKVYPVTDIVLPVPPQDEISPFGWNATLPNISNSGGGGGGGLSGGSSQASSNRGSTIF